ncbi:MAG: ATP synthase F1 subunit gamma [Veillonella sp.]|nr:ATP synthase F1 subunit gamma [Veillonella sp.]
MASAQDLRKRIKSVTNTQQITKAMKMVASARLRKAQTKAEGTRPYAEKIGQILRHMSNSDLEGFSSPLLEVRPIKRTCYIVIGADKGLAGAFSSNVLKFAMEQLHGKSSDTYRVITAGKKPRDSMKSRGIHIDKSYAGFSDKPSYEHARAIMYEALSEVIMIYTRFVNSMTQIAQAERLLPIEQPQDEVKGEEYDFMPSAVSVLEALLPKYLEITVYNGLLQSAASELGARMTAMTSATDNAGELIDSLGLEYNKLRQSSITNEISEIVGGANALQ